MKALGETVKDATKRPPRKERIAAAVARYTARPEGLKTSEDFRQAMLRRGLYAPKPRPGKDLLMGKGPAPSPSGRIQLVQQRVDDSPNADGAMPTVVRGGASDSSKEAPSARNISVSPQVRSDEVLSPTIGSGATARRKQSRDAQKLAGSIRNQITEREMIEEIDNLSARRSVALIRELARAAVSANTPSGVAARRLGRQGAMPSRVDRKQMEDEIVQQLAQLPNKELKEFFRDIALSKSENNQGEDFEKIRKVYNFLRPVAAGYLMSISFDKNKSNRTRQRAGGIGGGLGAHTAFDKLAEPDDPIADISNIIQ